MKVFYDAVILGGLIVCPLLCLLWIGRAKKRGWSAYIMAAAFLAMEVVLLALKFEWPKSLLYTFAAVLGVLLIFDFLIRSAIRGSAQ